MFDKMKQYTDNSQTAKLIELGFEKPKSISSIKVTGDIITTAEDLIGEPSSVMGGKITANYSIGELIEMLPPKIEAEMEDESDDEYTWLSLEVGWDVLYRSGYYIVERVRHSKELIDAIFEMLVQLKVEGVI